MTLGMLPPSATDTSLKKGESSWGVYGLQKALNFANQAGLTTDGVFGMLTESAVGSWQRRMSLTIDGIAGPKTQQSVSLFLCEAVLIADIPRGLPRGIVEGEGGYYFGAVNWMSAHGVDCGIVQERVGGPPFALDNLRHAFDAPKSLAAALIILRERAATEYATYAWASVSWERQLRCGIMAHNWPAGALSIAKTGRCSNPDSTEGWWPDGLQFPDGALVRTRWEWCQWYAMGGPHGPARIPRYVVSW